MTVAAGALTVGAQPVPEHCRVTGKVHERVSAVDGNTYAVGFEMRMPKNWNGRFLHQGNGGIDGSVRDALGATGGGPLTHALAQGFAVLSSDGGHSGGAPFFGIDPQARLDYGYQAVGKLTPMAKQAIELTYGKTPDRSYFAGCSNGGRHAMVAAARYFNDYDGILAGAPGYNLPLAATANLAGAREYAKVATVSPVTNSTELATAVTNTERALVASRVLAKCDALDLASDGLVQDVDACQKVFNLADDVPTCSGARDGTCLTTDQKTVLKTIFDGPKTSDGKLIYSSFPYDTGFGASGVPAWEYVAAMDRDSGALGFIWQIPPANPVGFSGVNYALNTDIDALYANLFSSNGTYTESAMSFMTPPDPTNMQGLRNRGGKVMVYHGVGDPIFSVNDSETWYKGVLRNTGDNFARFYRVPGMGHCAGGPATDQFDMLTRLVDWVERGKEPDAIVASARGVGNAGGVNTEVPTDWAADRTRPLCPYPKVAHYKGKGSLEVASSFVCRPPHAGPRPDSDHHR
ncbi:esterase [Hydrogenophaga sp. A37]|nr:esterase [Hydrogenophaga sp. A37]